MQPYPDLQTARREIVEAGARMYQFRLVVGLEGNLSAKVAADRVLTTPAGVCKGSLREDDLVLTGLDGRAVDASAAAGRPSTELSMHLAIYETRADVHAIVHGHPPYATAFAVAGRDLDLCLLPEVVVGLGAVPVSRYATPSTPEVARAVRELVVDHDAFLLRNHGAVCVGRTVMEAFHKLETLEALARVTLLAEALGGAKRLSAEQVRDLMAIRGVYGIERPVPACRPDAAGDPAAAVGSADTTSDVDRSRIARIIAEEIARAMEG